MQEMTPEICAASSENETKQLRDVRDDKSYWVTKLKDGNCWMTENLAIAGTTIKAEDSDFESGAFTLPNAKWDDSIDYSTPGAYVENGETYYNWDAATAGTGRGMEEYGTDAPGSICPKGWKLPRSRSGNYHGSGLFYALWSQYMPNINSYSWSGNPVDSSVVPLSLTFSGDFYPWGGEVDVVCDCGYWWSSTVSNSDYAVDGYVDSNGNVYPANDDDRLYGNSVRCVAAGE